MAKFKLDVSALKDLARNRYEVLALAGVGTLAVIFFLWGVLAFFGESSPEGDIVKDAERIQSMRTSGGAPPAAKAERASGGVTKWPGVSPGEVPFTASASLFAPGAAGENRRYTPRVLPLDTGAAAFQLDSLN